MNDLHENNFSTADLMKTFKIGRNTLRLYEEMGLLVGMARTESGYREFTNFHLKDLKFILNAKQIGFTLNEIKELLDVVRAEQKMTCGNLSSDIQDKVTDVEAQIKTLEAKKTFLSNFLKTCGSKSKDSECNVISAGFTQSACCE